MNSSEFTMGAQPASPDDGAKPLSPEDRALIERTRMVNKTLSVFVVALQEGSRVTDQGQIGVAEMLVALADHIRKRASENAVNGSN